jgi:16S rRNA (guanine1516-N2)-methyltransferase
MSLSTINASPAPLINNSPNSHSRGSAPETWTLTESGGRLGLVDRSQPGMSPVTVEFPAYLTSARGRSELASLPLIRAMGKRSKQVIDATAGMGQDSFALAVFGYSVIAFERSEKIAAMLADASRRLQADKNLHTLLGDRLRVVHGDAIYELVHLQQKPDVVYLDPMYPPKRKKSALARKEMQVLRSLVGDDEDSLQLFDVARKIAGDRVVVKRPIHAEPIVDAPSMSYESKLVRFDVYLKLPSSPEGT